MGRSAAGWDGGDGGTVGGGVYFYYVVHGDSSSYRVYFYFTRRLGYFYYAVGVEVVLRWGDFGASVGGTSESAEPERRVRF